MNKLDKWLWGFENRIYTGVVIFTRDVKILFRLYQIARNKIEELEKQLKELNDEKKTISS